MGVNELLVVHVDKGAKIDAGDADEGQAPEGNDLDQPVREEGGRTCRDGVCNILREEDPLKLDYEEINELFDIFK